jgi:hypothetical protein
VLDGLEVTIVRTMAPTLKRANGLDRFDTPFTGGPAGI